MAMSAHYIVAAAPLPSVFNPFFHLASLTTSIRSHLRASVWFSCDLLLVHPSLYITILVPSPSLSVCEDHLTVFIGGNRDQSSSIQSRLRVVSVGSFLETGACDGAAQIKAMAEGLPGILGQMFNQSPSANGFLCRPSISFVDVSIFSR